MAPVQQGRHLSAGLHKPLARCQLNKGDTCHLAAAQRFCCIPGCSLPQDKQIDHQVRKQRCRRCLHMRQLLPSQRCSGRWPACASVAVWLWYVQSNLPPKAHRGALIEPRRLWHTPTNHGMAHASTPTVRKAPQYQCRRAVVADATVPAAPASAGDAVHAGPAQEMYLSACSARSFAEDFAS